MAIITSTSFKGTTLEALAASPADIKASTKVTITDNTYTAANLITILGKTNNHPVILEKTAAGIPLSANSADLVTIIEGVNKYTGSLTANDPATAEQLNIIAKGTTGKVTATLNPTTTIINAATVEALKDVKATDAITFVTTETEIVGKSNLEAFVTLNKKLSDAKWTTIVDFKGTASELSAIKSALGIKKTAAVTITGQISAADANAIAKATDGVLTATLKSATVKATLSALKDIKATDVLDFTSTDTTVNASDLVALDKLVLGTNKDYTSITTITETAAAVAKDVSTVTGALGIAAANADVKISGNISATDAATIAAAVAVAGTGTLTATIFPGTAQNLETALNGVTNGALTLTLTDETVVAGDLDALNAVTTVAINANSVKTITADAGDVADVSAVYAAAALKQISGLGNEIISITGVAISAADTNTLAGLTSGKVVATVTPDSAAALLAALAKADAKDELTLTVTGASDAKDLLALDAKTALAITLPAPAAVISGTAAEIKKVYASSGITTANNEVITVTDPASAADVNAIAKLSGAVTATIKDGSVATTLKTLKDVVGADTITFKTTDKTVNADDLVQLKTLVDNFTTTSVTTITSKAADIGAAGATVIAALVIAPNAAVTITNGTISATDAGAISNNVNAGKVTATVAADLAANIVTGLGAVAAADADDALNITVNGPTASVADLNTIDSQTALKVKVDAATVTATNYAQFEGIYVTNKNNFSSLGDENIDVGGTVTASQADAIAKATSKEAKATVATATADVLVANLQNANAKDAFTLTVTGAATAKDLLTLDGKTNQTVVATAVTAITGSVAEVNKLLDADVSLNNPAFTLTGTVKASDADALALQTTGVVTANIAADTATNLNAALTDNVAHNNALTLTVNGATASAATLELLNAKTSVDIKVDAKEVTGIFTELNEVYVNKATDYENLGNENIKITDLTVAVADANTIANKTSGVVTATITSGTAAALNGALVDAGKQVNAYKLTVTGPAAAADLNDLDKKTSVVVNASAVGEINGSAADIKTVLAAKTITTAENVAAKVDGVISAADANTISKATTGAVTATVTAATAAALKSALAGVSNDNNDALTLKVSGATATAADLNALDAKTSVDVDATAVSKITGNAADVKKAVDVAAEINLDAAVAIDVSGTVSVADANLIDSTNGVVTATIETGTAATLKLLSDTNENAYKLTVSDTTIDAADLKILDGKTSVTVNAAAIKNIEGSAADVKAVYDANANKTISGLGNETVDLSDISVTDADVSLVSAINDFTTGVITLGTLNTATTGGNFSLSQLGDLKGITGLEVIKADNGKVDNITISIKDLLAANDSTNSFAFTITSDNDGTDKVIFTDIDTAGWTMDKTAFVVGTGGDITFTNNTNSQVITIDLDNVVL